MALPATTTGWPFDVKVDRARPALKISNVTGHIAEFMGGASRTSYIQITVAGVMRSSAGQHLAIQSLDDTKNVRINSRNVPQTSGSHSGVQIKPNVSVTGTASVTGLEVSPRFAASMGGADLVAIKADPLLKAGSGNLTGKVAAVEANIDFGTSGTRTITGDVTAFETFLAVPSTYTYSGKLSVMKVRDVNIKSWDYFLKVDSLNTGVTTPTALSGGTSQYLKVRVGTVDYTILMTRGS